MPEQSMRGFKADDVKREVTQRLITLIEDAQRTGEPFVLPFSSESGIPFNPVHQIKNRKFGGGNAFWLALLGVSMCATFKQWKKAGYSVQKGANGIPLIVMRVSKDKDTGEERFSGFHSEYYFSAADVRHAETGEPFDTGEGDAPDLTERLARADEFFAGVGADVRHNSSGGAFYSPARDFINMPHRNQFTETKTSSATECYYSTLAHEHVHWTGHKSRVDRLELKNRRGYAFEELIAEIGAAYLCADLGVSSEVREDHANYLASWLKALKDDPNAIWEASGQAFKAVQYLTKESEKSLTAEAA